LKIVNLTIKQNPHSEHEAGDLPKFVKENGSDTIVVSGVGSRAVDSFNKYDNRHKWHNKQLNRSHIAGFADGW